MRARVAGVIEQWLDEGKRLQKRRTLTAFAALINTPFSTVQRWSKAGGSAPEAGSLVRLAAALGLSGHWLLTGQGVREAPSREETEPYALARQVVEAQVRRLVLAAVAAALRAAPTGRDGAAATAQEAAMGDQAVRAAEAMLEALRLRVVD